MNNLFHIDYESQSEVEIGDKGNREGVGLYNYLHHPTTKPLMMSYALGNAQPQLWEIAQGERMPTFVHERFMDPKQPMAAWNSGFERGMTLVKLGIDIPIERWQDPQASSRYLSLTGKLEIDGQVLNLGQEFAKDEHGEDLIQLFSRLTVLKETKKRAAQSFFNDWNSHPKEWQEFGVYCKQDIVAEREIMRRLNLLGVFPLPERERRIWIFDQHVNDRGLPVNMDFVEKAYRLACRAKEKAVENQERLTGIDNANSPKQMLAWAQGQGYKPNTLRKERVTATLKYEKDTLTPLCIRVLEARKAASSTTYKKLAAIIRQVCPDSRLRNQFIYMGSARCGRWTGNGFQVHNLARPDKRFEDQNNIKKARALVLAEDYDGIIREFGKKPEDNNGDIDYGAVLIVVKNLIRTVFEVSK
jgi:DNA polymerase bacteriophage-type